MRGELNINQIKTAYFLGIGGIGMSAIARYFNKLGIVVHGYDKTPSAITDELIKEGMKITFMDELADVEEHYDIMVYTPAIPKDSMILNYFISNNQWICKRSEVLGLITRDSFTIAVSGSHGKTTVSSMIAHILKHTQYDCNAFLGGIAQNFNSNYVEGKNNVVVVEADEFDRSFHRLSPDIAVITSVDTDHLDIYGSRENIESAFVEFTNKIKAGGWVMAQRDVSILSRIDKKVMTYSVNGGADLYVTELRAENGYSVFKTNKTNGEFVLKVGGKHNVENILSAIGVALELGIEEEKIALAVADFTGIKRRFEKIWEGFEKVYIDDYAHHPSELKALLEGVRGLYPNKKIAILFQPHLFSRTRDLAVEFGASLNLADTVRILDIYPARELPMEGVTSKLIYDHIDINDKRLMNKNEFMEELGHMHFDVLLTVGAGDIDRMIMPIKEKLIELYS